MKSIASSDEHKRPGNTGPQVSVQRFAVWEFMILIAGLAVGTWVCIVNHDANRPHDIGDGGLILIGASGVLGGLALVGVPLLLLERRMSRRPWGPGKLLWFASGTSAWLLWPPMIHARLQGKPAFDTMSGLCFAYGTPLMAVYVTVSLLAGGWLRPGRRRARRRSWRESFGLLLGLAWACTGLYVLYIFYREDFSK